MSVLSLMANDLLLDNATIISVANRGNENYRRIEIEGGRIAWEPAPQLRLLQYWITDFLKEYGEKPCENATAYEVGSSIVLNASWHRCANHILKLDIRHFFPSINSILITDYLEKRVKHSFTQADIDLILKIVMFKSGLVMGAASSPYIANRVMIPIDKELECYAKKTDPQMMYTRYCDDLFFSSKQFIDKNFVRDAESILNHFGMKLNHGKTRFMGKGSNKWMAGVAIGSDRQISLGQRRKDELRKRLYNFALDDSPEVEDARRLQGYIAFAKQIEPKYVDRMLAKYASYGGKPIVEKIHEILTGARY